MARDKQTARKSTGGKAPRKTRAVRQFANPAPPVPTGVFPRDFVKNQDKISKG